MENNELDLYKGIGQRIREIRIERKMSQADLATVADISLPHVSEIENGKTRMRLATFARIADALQISSDALLRPAISEAEELCKNEYYRIFSDCSPAEAASLLRVLREVKASMRQINE